MNKSMADLTDMEPSSSKLFKSPNELAEYLMSIVKVVKEEVCGLKTIVGMYHHNSFHLNITALHLFVLDLALQEVQPTANQTCIAFPEEKMGAYKTVLLFAKLLVNSACVNKEILGKKNSL